MGFGLKWNFSVWGGGGGGVQQYKPISNCEHTITAITYMATISALILLAVLSLSTLAADAPAPVLTSNFAIKSTLATGTWLFVAFTANSQQLCRTTGAQWGQAVGDNVVDTCGQPYVPTGHLNYAIVSFRLENWTLGFAGEVRIPLSLIDAVARSGFFYVTTSPDPWPTIGYYLNQPVGNLQLSNWRMSRVLTRTQVTFAFASLAACSSFATNIKTDCYIDNRCQAAYAIAASTNNDKCCIYNFVSLKYSNATATDY
jgi:hypothetical protein